MSAKKKIAQDSIIQRELNASLISIHAALHSLLLLALWALPISEFSPINIILLFKLLRERQVQLEKETECTTRLSVRKSLPLIFQSESPKTFLIYIRNEWFRSSVFTPESRSSKTEKNKQYWWKICGLSQTSALAGLLPKNQMENPRFFQIF